MSPEFRQRVSAACSEETPDIAVMTWTRVQPFCESQRHFRLKMPKWALNIETFNETPAPN